MRRALLKSVVPWGLAALVCGSAQAQEAPVNPPVNPPPAASAAAPQSEPEAAPAAAQSPAPSQAPGRGGAIALIAAGSVLTAGGLVGAGFGVLFDVWRCLDGCQRDRIPVSIGLETGSFLAFGLGSVAIGYGATVLSERDRAPASPEQQRRRIRNSLAIGGGLLVGGTAFLVAAQAISGAAMAEFPEGNVKVYIGSDSGGSIRDSGDLSMKLMLPAYALSAAGGYFMGQAAARARMPVLVQPVVSTGMTGLAASGSF